MLKLVVLVECDLCGTYLEFPASRVRRANELAHEKGWTCYGTNWHVCTDCDTWDKSIQLDYDNQEYDNLIELFEMDYAEARFKFWIVEPLVKERKKFSTNPIEERREQVKQAFEKARTSGKMPIPFRAVPSSREVLNWLMRLKDSHYDDWRAFLETGKPKGKTRLHPDVERIVRTTIREMLADHWDTSIQSMHDEIVKRISEKLGKRMRYDNAIKFPSAATVRNRVNRHREGEF